MPVSDERLSRALEYHQQGNLVEAERLYADLVRENPNHADALHLSGVIAHQRNQHDRAIDLISQAIQNSGAVPDYHNNLGEAYRSKGEIAQAITHYRLAIELDRSQADAQSNLGLALQATGELEQAESSFRQAIAAQPQHAQAHNNFGILLRRLERLEEAIGHFRLALAVDPNFADAHSNLGNALWADNRRDDAFWHYRRALELDPKNVQAMINVGTALKQAGRVKESTEYYRQAAKVEPDKADAHYNLGVNLAEIGQFDEAIAAYRNAIACQPNHVKANKNLSVVLLTIGAFEEGFDLWEWRWQEPGSWRRGFDFPLWEGQSLEGKSLLIWAEQGVGDELMFGSVMPEIVGQTKQTAVECDPRLVPLFERAMPGVRFIARAEPPAAEILQGEYDYQIPMGGLCRFLRNKEEAFRGPKPYLRPDPQRVNAMKAKYAAMGDRRRIGISWRSIALAQTEENRLFKSRKSSPLDAWWPVLIDEHSSFFNLQYGDCAEDLAKIKRRYNVEIYDDHEINQLQDLDGFAAQIASMDLVISTSSTTVHMAGALGVPTWVLVADVPDWRWQMEREDCLWYPSVRIFRQQLPGDWKRLLTDISGELMKLSKEA